MSRRSVITERHIQEAIRAGNTVVVASANSLITPLARDSARSFGISITFENQLEPNSTEPEVKNDLICIGSDHGGFEMKGDIMSFLDDKGHKIVDLGTNSTKSCDYPDFAYAVARTVADGKAGIGIMIDGVGVGSSMVCNKIPGIRAACAYNEFAAYNARAHNNANVLTLGSRTMGIEVVKRIVTTFLETDFEGGRHAKRVQKIQDVESRFSRS